MNYPPVLRYILLLGGIVPLWFACTKHNNTPASPTKITAVSYTTHMGGIRNWHRRVHAQEALQSVDTTFSLPDTSFALTIVNNKTILFSGVYMSGGYSFYYVPNDTFSYDSVNSTSSVYYFGQGYYALQYANAFGIMYYPVQDSIVYTNQYTSTAGDPTENYQFIYTY